MKKLLIFGAVAVLAMGASIGFMDTQQKNCNSCAAEAEEVNLTFATSKNYNVKNFLY